MKLFHPKYDGIDVGVGGKQYRVEQAGNGSALVEVPDNEAHQLFEHGFRELEPIAPRLEKREPSRGKETAHLTGRGARAPISES